MPRLTDGLEQIFTDLGIVGAGYKLYFYQTGTLTPTTTYSDEALTVPNTNPIILNAAGRPDVDIWGADISLFRVRLTDTNDIVKVDLDPVDNYSSDSLIIFDPIPTAYWGQTAGTSSNYTLANPLVDIGDYSSTQTFFIDFHTANVASPDIDINGLGALNLKKKVGDGTKVDLEANDVLGRHLCTNDGVDILVLDPYKPYLSGINIEQATETFPGVMEIATQAEVDAGTNDTDAITPAKLLGLFGASARNTDGYLRIPANIGGTFQEVIIQWGLRTTSGNNILVNLPISFPNAFLCLNLGARDNNAISDDYNANGYIVNSSSFRYGVGFGNNGIFYIAIGY